MTGAVERPRFLIFRGELVPYEEARVHVLSTVLKFATAVFEGLRAYWNDSQAQLYCFRADDHFARLQDSMKVSRIPGPTDISWYSKLLIELLRANELRTDVHIRVQAFVDADDGALAATSPVAVCMAAVPRGRFTEAPGLHVVTSQWIRMSDSSMPPRVKAVANYHNSRLAAIQARLDGYDDAVLLTHSGRVAEGTGHNLFIARKGRLVTPATTEGILEGITRSTIVDLAAELGFEVDERPVDRTELYLADEMFFCGSAAEVVPVLSVDKHTVGDGSVGRMTQQLSKTYLAAARGEDSSKRHWLTPVYARTHEKIARRP